MKPVRNGLAWVLMGIALSAGAESVPGGSVEALLAIARQQSPEVTALRLEAEAARERAAASGALPDPVARMEWRNFTNAGSDASPSLSPARIGSTKYTLIQPLPFWGKRDLKREGAEAEAEAAKGRTDIGWIELAARIKTAYALDYALSQQLALTREVIELVDRLEGISRTRYAGGLAPQQDAIRARVERTAMQTELVQLENERHHAQVRINGLLARPAHEALAEPQTLRAVPASLDHMALAERLRARNPQLFADDARIRAAEKNRDAIYRNRYPDVALGLSPIQTRNRISEWELMLEVNIPLQQESRRSQEREAERMVEAARARREAGANQLLAELEENLSALEAARRVEMLSSGDLLPQAELTFQAALAGYENGKVDFATLLDAQRQIRKAKQDAIRAQAEQQARLADIERLVGEDL
ncbi:MAG TPA: TolC family protein [Rhodocyclaceae bacterium]|nr:TolC family protein [Rhodocyclaceae bacterium]